jgi:hypothetical protein
MATGGTQDPSMDDLKQAIQDAILDALNAYASNTGNKSNSPSASFGDLCDCFTRNTSRIATILVEMYFQNNNLLRSFNALNGSILSLQGLGGNQNPNPIPTGNNPAKTEPSWWDKLKTGASKLPVGNTAGTIQGGADILSKLPMVGGALGAVASFGASLWRGAEQLKSWGDQLHQANIQFAEFSGSMAVVQAESAFRQAQLSQERGERRAPAAKELAQANDRFSRALAPLEDAVNNSWSKIVGWLENRLSPVIEWVNRRLGLDDKEEIGSVAPSEFLYALAKENIKDSEYGNYDAFK